jgi:O-antigen/teichoic acid export membrane protein
LNSVLKSIGKTSAILNISLSALTVDTVVVILLSPSLGLSGAVVARAASTTAAFLYTLWLVRKDLPFQLDHVETMRVLASSLFLVPFVMLIEYVIFFPNPFLKLGVEVLAAVARYIAALFLFKTIRKKT